MDVIKKFDAAEEREDVGMCELCTGFYLSFPLFSKNMFGHSSRTIMGCYEEQEV